MGILYRGYGYRRICYKQGRHIGIGSVLWITLTLWIRLTEAQVSAPTTAPQCRGTLVDSGYIQSPNFPQNYPSNSRCSWRLLSKSNGTSIRIQFKNFDLESGFDFLYIYDEKNVLRRYTGNSFPPTTIFGKEARIEFSSDMSGSLSGFRAHFESYNITNPDQCMTSDAFWCMPDRKCISSNWRCDGYADCTSREDEYWCPSTRARTTPSPQSDCMQKGKFWCNRSLRCVPASYTCDKYKDCPYGEDEANCSYALQQRCQRMDFFWCSTSKQCIRPSWACDEKNDCLYGEDEQGCSNLSAETIAAIVVGCIIGVLVLSLLINWRIRVIKKRQVRQINPRSNNYVPTTARLSARVWSTPATYVSQFRATNTQAGGSQGAEGLFMDQYAPPSYDATIKAYSTDQYASHGAEHPPQSSPTFTAPLVS